MFLLDAGALLELLTIELRSTFVLGIGWVLITMLWMLIALSLFVVYKRIRRLISRSQNDVRHLNHLKSIFVFVQTKGIESFSIGWRDRYFVRRLILMQFGVMEEEELVWLRLLYRQFGYYEQDIRALKSRFWWVRLAALVRLETTKFEESVPWMTRLIEDPNDFVSIVAVRAISGIESPERMIPVLEALSRRAPARRDVFIEVLTNFGEDHVQDIIEYLNSSFDPHIASICIEALGLLGAEETIPVIESLALSSDDEVAESAAKALGEMGQEGALDVLRSLTAHEAPRVRAQAIQSLAKLKDPRLQWLLQDLKSDPSLPVRRSIFYLTNAAKEGA